MSYLPGIGSLIFRISTEMKSFRSSRIYVGTFITSLSQDDNRNRFFFMPFPLFNQLYHRNGDPRAEINPFSNNRLARAFCGFLKMDR